MLCAAALVTGCAATPDRYQIPPPRVAGLPDGAIVDGATTLTTSEDGEVTADGTASSSASTKPFASASSSSSAAGAAADGMTRLSGPPRTQPALQSQDWSGRFAANDQLVVAIEAMPLKDFVHYSFAEALKANYVMAQGLPGLDDPVTMNLEKAVSSRAYYKLVTELLVARGIGTTFRDGVYYLAPIGGKVKGNIPIGFGRRPRDVPEIAGKIMQVVPLRYGLNPNIEKTIVQLADAQVSQDTTQNAIFVTGERDAILRALDVVSLLDQPASRAREVGIINLNFVPAKDASAQLVTLLSNEGIPAAVNARRAEERGDGAARPARRDRRVRRQRRPAAARRVLGDPARQADAGPRGAVFHLPPAVCACV